MPVKKTYQEINEKIKAGKAVVLTAEEVAAMSRDHTPDQVAAKVDVVTTATFGPMCSSGMFINTGHATPPIRMERATLNGAIIGVVGPNGAGKTTLFHMITGKERPDSGKIELGQSVKIAYVDQERGRAGAGARAGAGVCDGGYTAMRGGDGRQPGRSGP